MTSQILFKYMKEITAKLRYAKPKQGIEFIMFDCLLTGDEIDFICMFNFKVELLNMRVADKQLITTYLIIKK